MNELEKIQHAKDYMDKLASGVDPINNTEMPEDRILNNVHLSRCFFFVSDILRQVIENDGIIGKRPSVKKSDMLPFSLLLETRERVKISDKPVMIKHFTDGINELVDVTVMKKLKVTAFSSWLLDKEFLFEETINGKKRKKPTKAGERIGIYSEMRTGEYGTYSATLYNEDAQRFLMDNIDEIIAISNGETVEQVI